MASDLDKYISAEFMKRGQTSKFFLDKAFYQLEAVKIFCDSMTSVRAARASGTPASGPVVSDEDLERMKKELETMEELFRQSQKCTLLKEVGLLHDYPEYKLKKIFPNWRENSKMLIFKSDPNVLFEEVQGFFFEKFGQSESGFADSNAFLEFSAFWKTKNESEIKPKLEILLRTVVKVTEETAKRYSEGLRQFQDIQEKVLVAPATELEEYKEKLILAYNAAGETPPEPAPASAPEPALASAPEPALAPEPAPPPVAQPASGAAFKSVFDEDSDSDQDGGGRKKTKKKKRKSKRRKKKSKRRKSKRRR